MKLRPLQIWAGVVGPTGFVAAWAIGGATTKGYSPVDDAISRLAATGADTRGLMTAGFVCFGVGVPVYGLTLRRELPGRAWLAAVASGSATLGVAAFPLDVSSTIDRVHGGFAVAGYITLAMVPLLASRTLWRQGHRRATAASLIVAMTSGACLAATAVGPAHGLFQRLGLTIVDGWLVASAIAFRDQNSGSSHQG